MTTTTELQTTPKLQVLVDANVLVAGIGWPRFPYEVLRHAFIGDFQMVLTERIILEARFAAKKIIPKRAANLATFLDEVDYVLLPTPTDQEIASNQSLSRDAKDVHVALAAKNKLVQVLISQDKDLTAPDAPIRPFVAVMLPAQFLRQYMGWTSEQLESIRARNWDDMTSASDDE